MWLRAVLTFLVFCLVSCSPGTVDRIDDSQVSIDFEPVRYDLDFSIDYDTELLSARCGLTLRNITDQPAALIPLILLVHHPYVVMVLLGMSAFVGPLWNVVIGTYEIKLPPDEMLGRVASVSSLIAWGVIPFGPLVAGLLVEHFGARATLIALALLMLVVALLATVNRSIRHAPPLD